MQAQATTAQTALRNLKNTLSQLKQVTKDGCGLSGVVSSLQELNSAASSINSSGAGKVIALVDALKGLKGLGKFDPIKTFDITNFIREAGLVASMIPVDAGTKIGQLASGISFLSGIDKVKIPATLSKNLEELAVSVSSVPADTATKLSQIGTALNGLAGVRDIKISSTIANNLMDVAIAVEQMDTVNFDNLDKLARGLSALNGVKISASIANNLTKLGDAADKLNDRDFSGFEKLAQSLAPITSQMNILGSTLPNISRQLGEVSVQAEKLSRSNGKAKDSMVNLYAGLMLAYKGISKIATAIAKLIDKSNSFIEDYNLFNASMGKYAEEAEEYARTVGDLMGIDPGKWMRNQGVFQTLATGFGIASDRAYIMSKNLTQLGYDLSSFFNIATEGEGGSMQKLQAGLAGELEPLRRLGFDLSEARLKAVALSLGIDQTYKSMSQAEKAQLRYYAIMTQVTTAQHDMARTLDTPANQLRILKAQVEQAGRAFGNIFIPALNAVLPYAIALANALRILGETLASFFGFSLPEVDYSGIDTSISSAADAADDLDNGLSNANKSATKLKHLLADWDELNIIQTESESGGSGKSKKDKENKTYNPEDWKWELPQYDFLEGLIKSRADAILKQFKPALDWVKDNLENIIDLAEAVGAAFIGWKLSDKLFPGMIATDGLLTKLLEGVGAVAVEFATVALNVHFTAKFLEDDDGSLNWGALVGGVLTNVAGSSLVGKIVRAAFSGTDLGESAGTIATGISFMINGLVTMTMGINDAESKGFTIQNLVTVARGILSNSLGTAFVTGQLLKNNLGGGILKAADKIAIGAAALGLSLNVALSMGFTKDVLNNTPEQVGDSFLKTAGSIVSDAITAIGAGYEISTLLGKEAGWKVTGAILALDAGMSVVLGAQDAAAEGFDWDNIMTIAKGALEAAGAGALYAHMVFPGYEIAAAGSLVTLMLGVGLSVYATEKITSEEKFNWGSWIAKSLSDVVTVAGSALVAKHALGLKGPHGITFVGAAIAIQSAINLVTTFGKVMREGWTYNTLISAVVDELKLAVAGGLILKSLLGLNPLATFGIVAGAFAVMAAATVFIALNNMKVNADSTMGVSWGTEGLTEEQVRQKVNSYFNFDVDAHIQSITIADTTEAVAAINGDLETIESQLTGIRIGVDSDTSYTNIKKMLIGEDGQMGEGTLIYKVKDLIQQNAATVADFVKLDKGLSADDIKIVGLMNGVSADIGKELTAAGEAWGKLFGQGFESVASEATNNILEYILNITQAATRGQREAEFNIAFGKLGLKDMTADTAGSVLSKYLEMEQNFWNTYKQDEDNVFTSMMSNYKSYSSMIENWGLMHPGEAVPQEYLDKQRQMAIQLFGTDKNGNIGTLDNPFGGYAWDVKNGYGNAKKMFEKDMEWSRKQIQKEFAELFSNADLSGVSYYKSKTEKGLLNGTILDYLEAQAEGQPGDTAAIEGALSTYLTSLVQNSMTYKAYEPVKMALEAGIIDIFDLFKKEDLDTILKESGLSDEWWYNEENKGILDGIWKKIFGEDNPKAPVMDTTDAQKAMDEWKTKVDETTTAIKTDIDGIGSMSVDWNVSWGPAPRKKNIQKKAEGGFVNSGEMFVAREAGPELVGRIGRRTAVANNDQIVTSVSEGVASGQREQTNLLRQQNDLLRQLLNKEFSTKVVPDSRWGRFNRECERLYARNTGT